MIYLDNSATTKPFDEVIQAVSACLKENYFNPSSAYGAAIKTDKLCESHRSRLAKSLYCSSDEIIFTSGATESNNIAILGQARNKKTPLKLITTAVEHPSVYECFARLESGGAEVTYLGVNKDGTVRLDELAQALDEDTAFVSIMHVNNETGAINDISAAYSLIKNRAKNAVFHVDGVQAFCKLPFTRLNCDMYSISGHKFHAIKGIGALYVKKGTPFYGGQIGGGQERGLRSGTTNTPGIVAMGEAVSVYGANQQAWIKRMAELKLRLYNNLCSVDDILLNGPGIEKGAPHILNVSFMGVQGETLLNALSLEGVLVSTGSACSAHKKGKNRVLCAMGVEGKRQEGAIRFSLSPFNTLNEMDKAAETLKINVTKLRRYKKR